MFSAPSALTYDRINYQLFQFVWTTPNPSPLLEASYSDCKHFDNNKKRVKRPHPTGSLLGQCWIIFARFMTINLVQEISLRSNKGSQAGKCDNHLLTGHTIFCSLTILELNTFTDRTKCRQHPISLRKNEFRSPSEIHTVYLEHIVAHQF